MCLIFLFDVMSISVIVGYILQFLVFLVQKVF